MYKIGYKFFCFIILFILALSSVKAQSIQLPPHLQKVRQHEMKMLRTAGIPSGDLWNTPGTLSGKMQANNIPKISSASTWQSMGLGVNSLALGMSKDTSGDIYVSGYFNWVDGKYDSGVARWNGQQWIRYKPFQINGYDVQPYTAICGTNSNVFYYEGSTSVPDGNGSYQYKTYLIKYDNGQYSVILSSDKNQLNSDQFTDGADIWHIFRGKTGNLYITGDFTRVDTVSATGIAMWDGQRWHALGKGLHPSYMNGGGGPMVQLPNGNLVVDGEFDKAGDNSTVGIAEWNGKTWTDLSNNLSNSTEIFSDTWNSLAVDANGKLYLAGFLYFTGSTTYHDLVYLNNNTWNQIQDPPKLSYAILNVSVDSNNNLIASGYGTAYQYDGASWQTLGSLGANFVYSQCVTNKNEIIESGDISGSNQNPLNNIAIWSPDVYTSSVTSDNKWNSIGNRSEISASGSIHLFYKNQKLDILNTNTYSQYNPSTGAISNLISTQTRDSSWYSDGHTYLNDNDPSSILSQTYEYNGTYYLVGNFNTLLKSGGVLVISNCYGIAKYDGSNWSRVGPGLKSWVSSYGPSPDSYTLAGIKTIVENNGILYAGGNFNGANGNSKLKFIAAWNGQNWTDLDGGIYGPVSKIINDSTQSGTIIVAGNFVTKTGNLNDIARWDGKNWSGLGTGINGPVNTIIQDKQGDIYAGGTFSIAGNVNAANVAMWDGSEWKALGQGLKGTVNQLKFDNNGVLYAAGSFLKAGNQDTVSYLAKWNGLSWSRIGSGAGVNNSVTSIVFDDQNRMYVGGYFNAAGNQISTAVASYDGTMTTSIERSVNANLPDKFQLKQNYPNPFNPTTNITYTVPTANQVTLRVYNVLGQLVATLVNKKQVAGRYTVSYDASKLSSGMYLYRLKAGKYEMSKKMMLIK